MIWRRSSTVSHVTSASCADRIPALRRHHAAGGWADLWRPRRRHRPFGLLSQASRAGTGLQEGVGWVSDRRVVSFAEYFPVRDMTWTSYPHVAYGHDVRAERDVAFDLEPLAAAQRRRPRGEPLIEI